MQNIADDSSALYRLSSSFGTLSIQAIHFKKDVEKQERTHS